MQPGSLFPALHRLEQAGWTTAEWTTTEDALQARIVELRFFLGLSIEETAVVLGKGATTVKREWRQARAWLFREMRAAKAG